MYRIPPSFYRRLLPTLLAFLSVGWLAAQSVVVETRLDSTAIVVGEQVRLHLRVACEARSKVIFPKWEKGELIPGVEVLESSPIDTLLLNDGKRWELSRSYLLTSFDSALYNIPQLEVTVNGTAHRSRHSIGLKVSTIDVDLRKPDNLRPAHAPVPPIFVWAYTVLAWIGGLWALGAALVAIALRLSDDKPLTRRIKIFPPPPPHQVAVEAFDQLRRQNLRDADEEKPYFIALTDVLRTYLHDRFGFNAREMTTHEIIDHLHRLDDVRALDELKHVLDTADLVKFARQATSEHERLRLLAQASDYVQQTRKDDPAATRPQERIVVVGDRTRRRLRLLYQVTGGILLLAALGVSFRICQLFWNNFL